MIVTSNIAEAMVRLVNENYQLREENDQWKRRFEGLDNSYTQLLNEHELTESKLKKLIVDAQKKKDGGKENV